MKKNKFATKLQVMVDLVTLAPLWAIIICFVFGIIACGFLWFMTNFGQLGCNNGCWWPNN